MKKIFTPVILALITFSFSRCTKTDVLADQDSIVGTWQVVGIRSNLPYDWNGDGYAETDIYGGYNYCERDIELAFDGGGTGQSRQGCNAYWQAMNWSLSYDRRYLDIQLQGDDLNLALTRFSNNIIIGEDQVYMNGHSFIVTYTLERR
ncbi:MAG: hypothetical protein ACJ75B_03335 [Flavisolibacter sp.]